MIVMAMVIFNASCPMAGELVLDAALTAKKQRQTEISQLAHSLASPVQIHSAADIMRRKAVFTSMKAASTTMIAALQHIRENMVEHIQTAALEAKRRNADSRTTVRALLKEDRAHSQYLQQMQADSEWAETMLHRLKLMKGYRGKWRASGDGKSIISDDQDFASEFQLLSQRASAIRSLQVFGFGLPADRDLTADYSHVLSAVTGYWNDDANLDRAVLLEHKPNLDDQELIFSELFIYLSDQGTESMKLALHKINPAWSGELSGTRPYLGIDKKNRLVIHSQNDAIGRNRWQKTITIDYINQRFVITAFSLSDQDTMKPAYDYVCTFNLLTGHGKKNSTAFTKKAQTLMLSDWSNEWIPDPCSDQHHQ